MTALVWDKVGERLYQTGIDRGVLYLKDGTGVAWNGLTDIDESSTSELKSFYLDGVKYLEILTPGDFLGKLKAFTYPEEFDSVNGIADVAPGLAYYNQPSKSFNLSYRTRIGNDIEGIEHGYKIHILYNIIATPDSVGFTTLTDSGVQPIEFSWSLTGIPVKINKFRPAVHISLDSTKTEPYIIQILEDKLYGTETTVPSLPSVQEVSELFGYQGALIIIDFGDGSWMAIDESNAYITMINATTFQINDVNAVYLDPETYEISSTNVGV